MNCAISFADAFLDHLAGGADFGRSERRRGGIGVQQVPERRRESVQPARRRERVCVSGARHRLAVCGQPPALGCGQTGGAALQRYLRADGPGNRPVQR